MTAAVAFFFNGEQRRFMFDAQCDLAALVYEEDQIPTRCCAISPPS